LVLVDLVFFELKMSPAYSCEMRAEGLVLGGCCAPQRTTY
jgi:hypothetical protein